MGLVGRGGAWWVLVVQAASSTAYNITILTRAPDVEPVPVVAKQVPK